MAREIRDAAGHLIGYELEHTAQHVDDMCDRTEALEETEESVAGYSQSAQSNAQAAAQSASSAAADKTAAAQSASQAQASASQAAADATATETAKTAAQTAKTAAEAARDRAEAAANTAEGAKTDALNAQAEAETASSTAVTAATNASRSETSASTDASRAEAAAIRAEEAAEEAEEHASSVTSVNGQAGTVVLTKSDLNLGNVDNTSDESKPISTATQTALNGKLDTSGGTMSGNLAMGSNRITGLATCTDDNDAATKAYVDTETSSIRRGVNLLDNWYFVGGGSQQGGGQFPINQRGQTSYSGNTYTIDRWRLSNPNITISVSSNCVNFIADKSYANFAQRIESYGNSGKTFTLSVLTTGPDNNLIVGCMFRDGSFSQGSDQKARLITHTFTVPDASEIYEIFIQHIGDTKVVHALIAAKLELGDHQTLAHQDANGNWVLNDPPPNYQQELAKCQRYLVVFYPAQEWARFAIANAYNSNTAAMLLSLPVEMRTTPTIQLGALRFYDGSNAIDSYGKEVGVKLNCNILTLDVTISDGTFDVGKFYDVSFQASSSKVIISAEL